MKNKFLQREIIVTGDGSHSLYLPALEEQFHSKHGAIGESRHVFIEAGWKPVAQKREEIAVFEMGFGTGLNAFLVLLEILRYPQKKVLYSAVEAFPLEAGVVQQLNYAEQLTENKQADLFSRLHDAPWNERSPVTENFILEKRKITLTEFNLAPEQYDLVFYDAFAPLIQPELWTEDIFRKLYGAMKPGGILVTYCSKGDVRRAMQRAGFTVEKLPGPPHKREMLRAMKNCPAV